MMTDLKQQILDRTRQGLDVFRHYVAVNFMPNKRFKNPLYNDTKASCIIRVNNKTGIYMMKDFGSLEYSGDCFWYVAVLTGMNMKNDFPKILRKIVEDMALPIMLDQTANSQGGVNHSEMVNSRPIPAATVAPSMPSSDLQKITW